MSFFQIKNKITISIELKNCINNKINSNQFLSMKVKLET
jgi:hypothetical protein